MSVYQVEEYYIYMKGFEISASTKERIVEHLESNNWTNYEFQDDDTALIVDDIEDSGEGESLEDEIGEIIG
jgi:hypoxanthine phosphoribosyltransferase